MINHASELLDAQPACQNVISRPYSEQTGLWVLLGSFLPVAETLTDAASIDHQSLTNFNL